MKKSYACRQTGFASIIILLGIAVIVLIGGVVVYQKVLAPKVNPTSVPAVSPTPNPTAGWKSYSNKRLNYQFKYPANLLLTEEPGNSIVAKESPDFNIPIVFRIDILTDMNPNKDTTNKTWLTNAMSKLFGNKWVSPSNDATEEIFVAGIAAVKLTEPDAELKRSDVMVFVPSGTDVLVMRFLVGDESIYNQRFVDQILSTFKFLD